MISYERLLEHLQDFYCDKNREIDETISYLDKLKGEICLLLIALEEEKDEKKNLHL